MARSKIVISVDICTSSATLLPTLSSMTRTTKCCPCPPSSTLSVSLPAECSASKLTMSDSKIVPGKTQNIFIDTTATDQTKLYIA